MTNIEIASRLYASGFILAMVRKYAVGIREDDYRDVVGDIYLRLAECKSDGIRNALATKGMKGCEAYVARMTYNTLRTKWGVHSATKRYSLPSPITDAPEPMVWDEAVEDTLDEIRQRLSDYEAYLFNTFLECDCDMERYAEALGTTKDSAAISMCQIQKKIIYGNKEKTRH